MFKYRFDMSYPHKIDKQYVIYDSNSLHFKYEQESPWPASECVKYFIYNDVGNTSICMHRIGLLDYIYFLDIFGKDD